MVVWYGSFESSEWFDGSGSRQNRRALASAAELAVPDGAPLERFDFAQKGIEALSAGAKYLVSPGTPPALGQWHTIRVVAAGDHIQGYLNGKLLLDHQDSRFHRGQVGLWTKADSVTAFDDLTVRGIAARG